MVLSYRMASQGSSLQRLMSKLPSSTLFGSVVHGASVQPLSRESHIFLFVGNLVGTGQPCPRKLGGCQEMAILDVETGVFP